MNFVVRVLVTALALWLTSLIIPNHVNVLDDGTRWGTVLAVVVVALILNVVNAIVKPLIKVLAFPLYLLTLGLFSLVVNALMLWIVSWVTTEGWFGSQPWGLEIVGGFWWFVLAALIVSVLQTVIGAFAPKKRR